MTARPTFPLLDAAECGHLLEPFGTVPGRRVEGSSIVCQACGTVLESVDLRTRAEVERDLLRSVEKVLLEVASAEFEARGREFQSGPQRGTIYFVDDKGRRSRWRHGLHDGVLWAETVVRRMREAVR